MSLSRREFLGGAAAVGLSSRLGAQEPASPITVVSGKPRDRGRHYGRHCKDPLRIFLDKEFGKVLGKGTPERDKAFRHAADCAKEIRGYAPAILEEMEGVAEGTGFTLEEIILANSHEELGYHGLVSRFSHKCAALAAVPPDTADGRAYVGQSYEWMWPCRVFHWKRPEGPSVIGYTCPGLLVSVGMNSSGVALCATSSGGDKELRVGIPYYVLSAQILYQESFKAALEEVRRAKHATWCVMVLGDGKGQLASIRISAPNAPVEMHRGHFGHSGEPRTRRIYELMRAGRGKLDRAGIQGILEDPVVKGGPIDLMLYDATQREAHIKGGSTGGWDRWHTFRFQDKQP